MQTEYLSPTPDGIAAAATLLQNGKVVAIPTETVYGLAADALDPDAVTAIFAAKGRPMDNPLIVHIADIDDWPPLVKSIPDKAKKLAEAFWPGPLTIILPAANRIPLQTRGGLETVAVRFPADPIAQAVILHTGRPLAAPSANRSGAPSPTNATRVKEDMDGRIAAVLDGGESHVGVESTVIDMAHEPPRLLRPGGVTPEMIENVIGPIEIDPAVTHAMKTGDVAASPGMKYKHYAPKAQVYLVKGTAEQYIAYVNSHADKGVAALCFDEDAAFLQVISVSYGHRNDALEQAHRVFDALRQLDEQGATTVYAASPCPKGVGLAVYNRMIRAAAFRVINTIRVIGLTGPTGAGKSSVAALWSKAGIPVIDADAVAREVVQNDPECIRALTEVFTPSILNADGRPDRVALAKAAFATPQATEALNKITHPIITEKICRQLEDFADAGFPLAILDAPLLFESGTDRLCDEIVAVTAPVDVRLDRIKQRDGLDTERAMQRIHAQPSDEFYNRPHVNRLINDAQTLEQFEQKAAALLAEKGWL